MAAKIKYALNVNSLGASINGAFGASVHGLNVYVCWTGTDGNMYLASHHAKGLGSDTSLVEVVTHWIDVPEQAIHLMMSGLINKTVGVEIKNSVGDEYADFSFAVYDDSRGLLRKRVVDSGRVKIAGIAVGDIEITDWLDQSDRTIYRVRSLPSPEKIYHRHYFLGDDATEL